MGPRMMRILIVDDNQGLTTLMREILEAEGTYQVETAENGEDGYLAFLRFKPDIILTDIDMPVKNGLDMVTKIRAHRPGIKAIYMSGDMRRYQRLLEREKAEYKANLLDKPFSLSKVMGLFHEFQKEEGLQQKTQPLC